MKLTTDQFDIKGCEIGRTWRQALVYGLILVGRGQRGGGPGWGLCANLWLGHRCGRLLGHLAARVSPALWLLGRLRRRRG